MAEIKIGERLIGDRHPCFIIAEAGVNHQGKLEMAKRLVDVAAEAGADAVKFQMRHPEALFRKETLADRSKEDLPFQYNLDIIEMTQLSKAEFRELAAYCKEKGTMFLCTPWEKESVDELEELRVPAYKVASADLTNLELLEYIAAKGKPLMLSTGMSSQEEIDCTVEFLKKIGAKFALLHCNSTYPAPYKDLNLNFIKRLKRYNVPVGYSGHERGIAVAAAAVALGANIIEKHFTLDRSLKGPDHAASLEPQGLIKLIRDIRNIELSLGIETRFISQGELINRETLGKSLVASKAIKKGEKITREKITARSPGKGLSPQRIFSLVGKTAIRDIPEHGYFTIEDINEGKTKIPEIRFKKKWGMIVRYHDVNELLTHCSPDIIDFHLSYRDLQFDYGKVLKTYSQEVVLHAPELFEDDNLLDLCTENSEKRELAVKNLQRVIDLAVQLKKKHFTALKKPVKLVLHAGGFSRDEKMTDQSLRNKYYRNLKDSLKRVDSEGVELLIENMPPFPWLFGGQRYHNIFTDAEEIADFCEETGFRMCFDTSHAALYCASAKKDLNDFARKIKPYCGYIHIADAAGVDGEGLQIDDGEIDFRSLFSIFRDWDEGFVAEIWQGHKFGGEGFWKGLQRLMKYID
ncbi:MAG TPA: N-acetylneuraminate synthase family protein [Candidatus Nanoarchaeia archaeon]|nr:N-acetylneuraminate synthase family protein [Candidatus Nanoarchaeia archaeon]